MQLIFLYDLWIILDLKIQLVIVICGLILGVVVRKLPSPLSMSEERVEKLMCSQMRKFDSLPPETQNLKQCKNL